MNKLSCACRVILLVLSVVSSAAAQNSTPIRDIWSIERVMSERVFRPIKRKPKYCNTGPFKPCVCPADVPSIVQYRPALRECAGKAAIILSGKYKDIFSVVVRDKENKDRWPANGINGCTPYETNVLALNKCSAFKAQKVIEVSNASGDASVHCLGASGYSVLFRRVRRMTAKVVDVPDSTSDPLARWCLRGPAVPLN